MIQNLRNLKLGLSQKITLGFMTVVTLAVLAIGIVVIQLFHSYVFESRQQSMTSRAQDIAAITAPYLSENGNMRGYGAFVRFFDSLAGATVWITDVQGRPLIATDSETSPTQFETEALTKENLPFLLKGQSLTKEIHTTNSRDVLLAVSVPIKDTHQLVVGAVFMVTPITGINSTIHQALLILAIGLIAALLMAFLLGQFFSRRLTHPLKMLNRSAREVAEGHFDVMTNIEQDDEIGQLSNSFDHMTLRLKDTIEQLFLEKTKLSDVLSSISEGLMIYDATGTLISTNAAALKLLGYESIELLLEHEHDLQMTPWLRETLPKLLEQKPDASAEVESSRPPRLSHMVEIASNILKLTMSPYQNSSGFVAGVVVFIQDISESEQLERMRREFIANVSHELRTPLTLIRGSMEAIRDGAVTTPEEIGLFQDQIVNETLILERLVNDLLDLSKLESGKLDLQFEELHPKELVEDTLRLLAPLIQHSGTHISVDFEELPDHILIHGDYDRLRQILLIFMDNAIKYSPHGGDLLIRTVLVTNASCAFHIIDRGMGIPEEDLPHIWDRFYRSDKSRSGKIKGSGLGLSIAKRLVELHGGTARAESTYGEGTHMTFTIPLTANCIK